MSTTKKPDEGCLSVLSSCFKGRGKGQPEYGEASRPTSNVVTVNGSVPLTSRVPQQPASTPQSTSDSILQSGDSNKSSSEIINGTPSSNAPESEHASLSANHSKAPLDLWGKAYNAAEYDTQKWINENVGEGSKNTNPFPELVELVRSSEEKLDKEAWQFEFHGHPILLREYTSQVTTCLTTIGDIAINFAPAPSPIVWNALKVVLKANVSQVEDRASIMGCTNLVLCLIRRGIVYEEIYLDNSSSSDAQGDLKDKLVSVYKTCLDFLAFTYKQLGQGNMRRFLKELVEPGQGERRVSDMKTLEQELEFATRPCEVLANRDRSSKHQELLRSLQLPLKRIDDTVTSVLATLEEDKRKAIMDYLSTIPVGIHHNEKCKSRTEGTCEWLVDHSRFKGWEDSSSSSIFWLQGNMGTGKSYLSSKVIDRYLVREENRDDLNSQHDEGFGFFYCYRSDPSRRNTESILRSYIRQLSELPRRPGRIHKASLDLHESSKNIQHGLTIAQFKDTLIDIANSYPRVTLVLDALDECTDEARYELVELFQCLVEESKGLVKVFIASRREVDIERYLQPRPGRQLLVSISTSDNAGDIRKFITHEVRSFPRWDHILPHVKLLVENTIVEKSDGMFRWAYLQWQRLKTCYLLNEIYQRLERMPRTLSDAYDEIYNRFEPDDLQRLMLQRAIRWVLYAKRPLDSVTLLAAIESESRRVDAGEAFHWSDLTPVTLELICRDLIVRDSELDTWGFPHASVPEYFLLKGEPWIENAKSETTISLIHFLINCCTAFSWVWPSLEVREEWRKCRNLQTDAYKWFREATYNDVKSSDPLHPLHGLQRYTQNEWLNHLYDITDDDPKFSDVGQAVKQFLSKGGPRESSAEYRVFCKYIIWFHRSTYDEISLHVEPSRNSTFGIIALDLCRFLPGWWDQELDPSELSLYNEDLLTIAAKLGRKSICKDLLQRGFDMNMILNRRHRCPLIRVIETRNIDMVRWMLKNGADPNLTTGRESRLCTAALTGPEYVQTMLDAGANPNILCDDCPFGCALSAAAFDDCTSSVEALIEAGAELSPKLINPRHPSPLAAAIEGVVSRSTYSNGRGLECARLLLRYGANAKAPIKPLIDFVRVSGRIPGIYESTLEAATVARSPELARLLVEYGADVKTPLECQGYDTILEYAVIKGDVDFARFLIEHGADVHSRLKIGKYGSLLTAATVEPSSSLDMVKFLVVEARVDLEQLQWKLSPAGEDTTSERRSSTSSLLSGSELSSLVRDRYEEEPRSRAEKVQYLIDVHKVDPQVLRDLQAQYE